MTDEQEKKLLQRLMPEDLDGKMKEALLEAYHIGYRNGQSDLWDRAKAIVASPPNDGLAPLVEKPRLFP